MPNLDSLAALLEDELKDIYDAEKQITKALPKIINKATAPDLKRALQEHLRQTEQQSERLEQVFEQLELPAKGKKCLGMQNLLKEGAEMMKEAADDDTRDALIIAAAQKVEHYEIATYGTLRVWANLLGHSDSASLFEESLVEEKEADRRLTEIAESFVNQAAADNEDETADAAEARASGSRRRRVGASAREVENPMAADRGPRRAVRRHGSTAAAGRSRSR